MESIAAYLLVIPALIIWLGIGAAISEICFDDTNSKVFRYLAILGGPITFPITLLILGLGIAFFNIVDVVKDIYYAPSYPKAPRKKLEVG